MRVSAAVASVLCFFISLCAYGQGGWTPTSTATTTQLKVGVGTTSPGAPLDVGAGSPARGGYTGAMIGGTTAQLEFWTPTASAAFSYDGSTFRLWQNGGVAWRNTVIVDSGGKMGIGIAPSQSLDVLGSIHASGDINADGTIYAKYQDVAEWVDSSSKLDPATVVVLDPTHENRVKASSTAYDTSVAGVVSASPGVVLGAGAPGKEMIATTGRVKVRADAGRGAIAIGDLLVTSDVAGTAMKSQPLDVAGTKLHRPGTVIGKALQPLASGRGEILVLLSLQ